jgi:hypothetical protein
MNGEERKHLVLQLVQFEVSFSCEHPDTVRLMEAIDAVFRSKGEAGEWKERKKVDIMTYHCHKRNMCGAIITVPLLLDAICALGYEVVGCYGDMTQKVIMFKPVKKTNEFTK